MQFIRGYPMQMSEIKEQLESLQTVLDEKYKLEKRILDLPKELDTEKASLERFKKEFIERNADYEAQKAKVAALEIEFKEAQRCHENYEKEMGETTTSHHEGDVLDKKIQEADQREREIRKSLEIERKALDQKREKVEESESLVEATKNSVNEKSGDSAQELEGYNEKLKELEKQEAIYSEGIPPEDLLKFQRIIKRNSIGIVAVHGGKEPRTSVCMGCNMILPDQFANRVRANYENKNDNVQELLYCPYCSRVLYYENVTEVEAPIEEAGALYTNEDQDTDNIFDNIDGDEFGGDGSSGDF